MLASRKYWLVTTLVAFGMAWSTGASAQEIRNYGEQSSSESTSSGNGGGGGESQTYYPGQPVPESNSGESAQGEAQETTDSESESERDPEASYAVKLYKDPNADREEQASKLQEILNLPTMKLYGGIIPGERNKVDHLSRIIENASTETRGPNQLTWLGFQPEDERTRIFVQTSQTPKYDVERSQEGELVTVVLQDTEVSARNFSRSIDTSAFARNVRSVKARQTDDRTVEVRIRLDQATTPSVERDGDYLFIDFKNK